MRGCTTLLAGREATRDGSVMAAFNSDGGTASWLVRRPRAVHADGDAIPVYRDWRGGRRDVAGSIPQVPETAQVLATDYLPAVNEHGVGIVLNACRGRFDLNRDPTSSLSHFQLLQIGLERARTAREAIRCMGVLVEEHGFLDAGPFPTGKNVGIIDGREAWWMEIPGGHQWVAVRVPDDAVSGNANRFWLGELDPDDGENVMRSEGLVSCAAERGWHDPRAKRGFDFTSAYGDADWGDIPSGRRVYSTLREWRIASLVCGEVLPAPLQGVEWSGPHVVVPRDRLDLSAVFRIMRDHYEGTAFDTRRPENGGDPNGCPHPPFRIPTPYPRPIDMFNTQMSYVIQSRAAGAKSSSVLWFAVHSPSTGCYVPFHPEATRLHPAYGTGDQSEGAFWKQFTLNLLIRQDWRGLAGRARAAYDRLEEEWMADLSGDDRWAARGAQDGTPAGEALAEASDRAAEAALEACSRLTHDARAFLAETMMRETLDELPVPSKEQDR